MPSTLAIKKEWGLCNKQENNRRKGSHQISASQREASQGIEVYTPKGEDQLKEWKSVPKLKIKHAPEGETTLYQDPE